MSDTATQTINAEVIDTDATTSVDNQSANATEMPASAFDAEAVLSKAMANGKANAQAMNLELGRLASQASYTSDQLSQLLVALQAAKADGSFMANTGFSADEVEALTGIGCHYFAGSIARSLDEQHNALRVDICSKDSGHGIYAEGGPIGHAGLGLGFVSKQTKDGVTTTKRTGAGVYIRADHVMAASANMPAKLAA